MNLVNETPFDVFVMASQIDPPHPSATIIVKGTFSIAPDTVAEPVSKEEQESMQSDQPFMDDIGRSLAWASDLEPQKPFAELVVYGQVFAPGGRPAAVAHAVVRIGDWQKRIVAFGDRVWARGPDGAPAASAPIPFTAIPLRWEFSFGGLDDPRNPMGRGIDTEIEISPGVRGLALPNIENPDALVAMPSDRPDPVNLGPVPMTFDVRARKLGTRDRRWATFRAPLPPENFDASFHNAAPEDQQFETPFRGDEVVELEGLHPEHAQLRFQLPALRLRVFLVRDLPTKGSSDPTVEETPIEIDTVAINPQDDQLVLLWRGYAGVGSDDMSDLIGAYVAQEPLDEAPKPASDYLPEIRERLFPQPTGPSDEEVEAELIRVVDEAHSMLDKVDLPTDVKTSMLSQKDPVKLLESILKEIHRQADAARKFTGS